MHFINWNGANPQGLWSNFSPPQERSDEEDERLANCGTARFLRQQKCARRKKATKVNRNFYFLLIMVGGKRGN